MFKINIMGKLNNFKDKWAVYKIYQIFPLIVIHVGVERLSQFFTFTDSHTNKNFNPEGEYIFEMVGLFDNKGLALRESSKLKAELQLPIHFNPRTAAIRCIETNKIYRNANEAAKAEGIAQSHLSNHLNNKPGYNTVKGKTFEKINHAEATQNWKDVYESTSTIFKS